MAVEICTRVTFVWKRSANSFLRKWTTCKARTHVQTLTPPQIMAGLVRLMASESQPLRAYATESLAKVGRGNDNERGSVIVTRALHSRRRACIASLRSLTDTISLSASAEPDCVRVRAARLCRHGGRNRGCLNAGPRLGHCEPPAALRRTAVCLVRREACSGMGS